MMKRIERARRGVMKPGQDLAVAGFAGAEGARIIAEQRRSELDAWFSAAYIDQILTRDLPPVPDEAEEWAAFGAAEWEPVGEGGIFTALWNLSGAYEQGIAFYLRRIPLLQETVEICERFELNPYRLYSASCVLFVSDHGGRAVDAFLQQGIPAAVIGSVNQGIKREIYNGEVHGYLDRPQPDELLKAIPGYHFKGGNHL